MARKSRLKDRETLGNPLFLVLPFPGAGLLVNIIFFLDHYPPTPPLHPSEAQGLFQPKHRESPSGEHGTKRSSLELPHSRDRPVVAASPRRGCSPRPAATTGLEGVCHSPFEGAGAQKMSFMSTEKATGSCRDLG